MADPVTAAVIMAATMAATTGTQMAVSHHEQKAAREAQENAQAEAKREQQKSERDAEQQRLEGIASNQTATTYGNIWGVDNAYANRYKDAAQKLSAGTGSFDTDDDDNNPFYTRGLL